MKCVSQSLIVAMIVSLFGHEPAWSLGLAARFGDVVVENAQIGRTYNLRETLKIPFGIENRSNTDVEVVVEFQLPEKNFLKKNYEAIPDPSWIKALPARMKIGPNSQGFFDLLLTIPDDPSLNGKHYQAMIKAKTAGNGLFGVAIENWLRFSIGPGPETLKQEKRQNELKKLDFDVSPQMIYLTDVPLGKPFDAKKEQRKSIRVANFAEDPLPIQLKSVKWNTKLYQPSGYEPIPDPGWITFVKDSKEIESESIGVFSFVVTIPNEEKYRGKNYSALIQSGLSTGFWLDAPIRVYISTEK